MRAAFLVLNAGSSSLKFALYSPDDLSVRCRGQFQRVGDAAELELSGPDAGLLQSISAPTTYSPDLVPWLLARLTADAELGLLAVGHRIVHGGAFADPVKIDPQIIEVLLSLTPLAPEHQPRNLAPVQYIASAMPGVLQVGCFDTAFHRTLPRLAQLYPLPRNLIDRNFVRYGFHGLSYAHIARTLPSIAGEKASGRVVVAHLGHGASLCGLQELRSVATTMGFTTLDGLMMGTRSGSVDPGLILYLLNSEGMKADQVARLLNLESGLLGVSGISDDVRVLEASPEAAAREALDLFAYRVVREVGSLMAALRGLDIIVFTGGVGEHSPGLRQLVADGLNWAGVSLDPSRNRQSAIRISSDASEVDVYVIGANEELEIAKSVQYHWNQR